MPRKIRDYKDEYEKYQGTPEQLKKQSDRHKARRAYEKANGPLPDSVDVDHKKPLSKGGSATDLKNLRAVPKSKNRSFARTKTGKMK
jgi:5-methylcytosine-specific restriction endonuclease McrA